jgi:formylglycine-generating enzyme required for sulfatase activity
MMARFMSRWSPCLTIGLCGLLLTIAGASPILAADPPPRPEPTAAYLKELRADFTNSVGMKFLLIEPGSFLQGSDEPPAGTDEGPPHEVTIRDGFYLGETEVTQAQWQAVMGYNNSLFQDPNRPVEKVAWLEVQQFLRTLNDREGTDKYVLPTESEWEYACRAGTTSPYFWGTAEAIDHAWFRDNSEERTHPVASRQPNALGFYDMAGNVSEWCQDLYAHYPGSPLDPPAVDDNPTYITRGGSWASRGDDLRSPNRSRLWHHFRLSMVGFRVKARLHP